MHELARKTKKSKINLTLVNATIRSNGIKDETLSTQFWIIDNAHSHLLAGTNTRWLDRLGWDRECNTVTIAKNDWLEVIRNRSVHDRTVPILLDKCIEILHLDQSAHLANLVARQTPACEILEMVKESACINCLSEVQKSKTLRSARCPVHGQIYKIVSAKETLCINQSNPLRPGKMLRNLAHDQSCGRIAKSGHHSSFWGNTAGVER